MAIDHAHSNVEIDIEPSFATMSGEAYASIAVRVKDKPRAV